MSSRADGEPARSREGHATRWTQPRGCQASPSATPIWKHVPVAPDHHIEIAHSFMPALLEAIMNANHANLTPNGRRELRNARLRASKKFVGERLPDLISLRVRLRHRPGAHFFRHGKVSRDIWESDLFRLASLTWAVPISNGFGRRLCYLVWEEHNDKLIGLIAIGDPVFNL